MIPMEPDTTYAGTLGRRAIKDALAAGDIVCTPAPSVQDCHIDVTLGEWYWSPRRLDRATDLTIVDPREIYTLHRADSGLVIFKPGVTLCHTEEYIGTTVPHIRPDFDGRSTSGRFGLSFHQGAGRGDPGFHGRWTCEVHNPWGVDVTLQVGSRVAMITFSYVVGNDSLYVGRYHAGPGDWTPEMMLPRRGNW